MRGPVELLHHPGQDERDVGHPHAEPGADPPPCAKRDHLHALHACHVRLLPPGQEPLRVEGQRVPPRPRVFGHARQEKVHVHARRYVVAAKLSRFHHGVGQREVGRRVLPQQLLDERLQERDLLQVLVVHHARAAARLDLGVEPGLHVGALDQAGDSPLDRGSRRVRSAVDELGAKRHQLVVRRSGCPALHLEL